MNQFTERWIATEKRLDNGQSLMGSLWFVGASLVIAVATTILVNVILHWVWPPLVGLFWIWVLWRVVKFVWQHLAGPIEAP